MFKLRIVVKESHNVVTKGTTLKKRRKVKGIEIEIFKHVPCEDCSEVEQKLHIGKRISVVVKTTKKNYDRVVIVKGQSKLHKGDNYCRNTGVAIALQNAKEKVNDEHVLLYIDQMIEYYTRKAEAKRKSGWLLIDKTTNHKTQIEGPQICAPHQKVVKVGS